MAENKPIYANGVDVSGCDFLAKEDDYCSYSGEYRAYKGECICSDGKMCKGYPNCFYKKALKQLTRKEQECEDLKKDLHKNFKEKDILHLIIDRLLEASGYDTNTANAEDFEDVYENMRYEKQQLNQLKTEKDKADQKLEWIREICKPYVDLPIDEFVKILQIIDEVE